MDTPAVLPDARQSLGPAQLDDLYPEDKAFRRSLFTFSVLLTLAALIASFGLYQDSVASIIGAMVVAPLGGAIMAFAGALVTARDRWMAITFAQVSLGALGVIVIGFGVSLLLPNILELTPSLAARTSPGLLDLGVALAAGAAGAYIAVRRTGSDALPGVAIAVSLVPPLATVGICLELGRPDDAMGALLLFLANFSAIVVAACVVFVLAGALPAGESGAQRMPVRRRIVVAGIVLVVISIPLALTSYNRALATVRENQGAQVVADWIGTRKLVVTVWTVDGSDVLVGIAGSDGPPDPGELAKALAVKFGAPVNLEVNYEPEAHLHAAAAP